MAKNIGWSKKVAEKTAKSYGESYMDAYAQKEEHFNGHFGVESTYQWIVILQKKPKQPKP